METGVPEGPQVGILMDIGVHYAEINRAAQAIGLPKFGEGYRDNGPNSVNLDSLDHVGREIMHREPNVWSSIVRGGILMAQAAENDEVRASLLEHTAAIIVAWIDDLNSRPKVVPSF